MVARVGVVALVAVGVFFLWPSRAVDAPQEASIAVLPFTNMSGSDEDEFFSDGVTEDIITKLAKLPNLRVIARTSIMSYKGTEKDIRQIADELGVTTVLEGSVRRSGDDVRVTAQLIEADRGTHLWAETITLRSRRK